MKEYEKLRYKEGVDYFYSIAPVYFLNLEEIVSEDIEEWKRKHDIF